MSGGADEGPRRVGRPRVGRPRADRLRPLSGRPPREELLCAAAELFTVQGYAATTTRAVAERAGMRQATMYHYFGGKEDLLAELLESTVGPSLAQARRLLADTGRSAARRLWELCLFDVLRLCGAPYNLGALYLLPEVGVRVSRSSAGCAVNSRTPTGCCWPGSAWAPNWPGTGRPSRSATTWSSG